MLSHKVLFISKVLTSLYTIITVQFVLRRGRIDLLSKRILKLIIYESCGFCILNPQFKQQMSKVPFCNEIICIVSVLRTLQIAQWIDCRVFW